MEPPARINYIAPNGGIRVGVLLLEAGVSPTELARALGVQPQQVHAWLNRPSVRPTTAGAMNLLTQFARVARFLQDIDDGAIAPDRRQAWLRRPLPAFRGESPMDLLLSGRGADVVAHLWGVYSGDVSL